MAQQIIIGLTAEGTTDNAFLKNVIYRIASDIALECSKDVEIFDVQIIDAYGATFVEKTIAALRKAYGYTHAVCIHTDADGRTNQNVLRNKFLPLKVEMSKLSHEEICDVVIPTIPVQMIESWMLADKSLFKELIDAKQISDKDLSIDKMPEQYADPKAVINNAIQVSLSKHGKRRRDRVVIGDLYEILGNSVSIAALRKLPSFREFEENMRTAFRKLNLLY